MRVVHADGSGAIASRSGRFGLFEAEGMALSTASRIGHLIEGPKVPKLGNKESGVGRCDWTEAGDRQVGPANRNDRNGKVCGAARPKTITLCAFSQAAKQIRIKKLTRQGAVGNRSQVGSVQYSEAALAVGWWGAGDCTRAAARWSVQCCTAQHRAQSTAIHQRQSVNSLPCRCARSDMSRELTSAAASRSAIGRKLA